MQLRNILIITISFSFFISCKTTQSIQHEKPAIIENALLWEINGNDLNQKSYLYGTMHLIDTSSFFWPKNTLEVLKKSDVVCFEVDMSLMDDVSKQMSMMSKATMKGDKSLSDLLSPEEYKIVDEHFRKMGLPLFFLERIKPMFLTVFASSSKKNVSYELKLLALAKEYKKSISGLETMEYQLSIFDSIPYEDQAQSLLEAIQMEGNEDNDMNKLIRLYRDQNINQLYTLINQEMDKSKGQQYLMLDGRNLNWIPVMDEMMKSSSHFFAVGAGHLAGPKGVITLLRKKGFNVIPLRQIQK